jgi:hypothetical protein
MDTNKHNQQLVDCINSTVKPVVKTAEQKRDERDAHQRVSAKARFKALRKMLPKKQRERDVKAERDAAARMKVVDVEEQGFSSIFAGLAGAALGSVAFATRRAVRAAEKASGSCETLMDSFRQKLEEFATYCKSVVGNIWVVPVAILAHSLVSQFIDVPVMVALSGAVLLKLFGAQVWTYICKYFQPETQSGGFSSVGGLICATLCASILPKRNVPFALGELMKRMANFERAKEGFEGLFRSALKYAERAVNVMLRMFSKEEVRWIDESERLVDNFCLKVDEFERLSRGNSADINITVLLKTVDTQLEAIGLKATVRDDKLKVRLERALARLSILLTPYQGVITSARNFRPEPTFLCFYGGSGLGKTTMVTKLACTILVMSGLATFDEALKNLWQKGNTEYWNGYANQKCLIMDDCFQIKPVKGESDNEYMNVIRMIGNWAYALNFADLESKGKFYFDTPLVIGTTNCASVANQADVLITQPEAVVRRIKHPYKIWVSEGYRTEEGMLDYAKVEAEFSHNLDLLFSSDGVTQEDFLRAYPWHAWYLTRHDFANPQESGARKELIDLIKEVVEGIKRTNISHEESLSNLERYLQGLGCSVVEQSGLPSEYEVNLHDSYSEDSLTSIRMFHLGIPRSDEIEEGEIQEDGRTYKERMCACIGHFTSWLKSLKSKLGQSADSLKFVGLLGALVVVVALAKAIYGLVCDLFGRMMGRRGKPRGRVKEQSNIKESKGVPSKVYFRSKVRSESGLVDRSHMQNIIYENNHRIYLAKGTTDEVVIGQIQFIESNLAMQPRHFTRQLTEKIDSGVLSPEASLTFVRAIYGTEFHITVGQFLSYKRALVDDHDVEFVAFPRGSISAKKISHYFLDENSYQKAIKAAPAVRLDVMQSTGLEGRKQISRHVMHASGFAYLKEISSVKQVNRDVLSYAMDTEVGMCGAPLMISENRYYGGRCYLGMHVAGSPGLFKRQGFATIVTLEMVEDAKRVLHIISDEFVQDVATRGVALDTDFEEQAGVIGCSGLVEGSFTYIGKVDKPVSLSPDSKLKLSPIGEAQAFGPNPQRPAVLKPFVNGDGQRVSPMLEGLKAYKTDLEYKVIPDLEAIVSLATKPFRELSVMDTRDIFTKEEAVLGVEGLKIKSIARSTSAGYPYVLDKGSGKKAFFGDSVEFSFDSQECAALFERVDFIVDSARRGVRLAHIFTDFLKDETRPHAKVDAGATRVISGAPLDYVIAFRQYFGAFMASMFKHHTDSGMCPGINPFCEWWKLASNLCSKGTKVFDGDFKRFDASEQPYIHYAILDFINRWYDDGVENARIREVLWLELVNSRHLGGDGRDQSHVYQWNKSLPSGHPFTTPVNSLYSLITLTACYVKATGDYVNMWDRVYIATFGDDNITNVSDSVSEVFNQVTVARDMQELFGLTYTSGSKDGLLRPYTILEECTFLKRRFVRNDLGSGGWIAPLEPSSFLYISYYYRNNRDMVGEVKNNLENTLGELALHDENMWNEYFPLVRQVMSDMGRVPDFESRSAYRDMMSARLDAWF